MSEPTTPPLGKLQSLRAAREAAKAAQAEERRAQGNRIRLARFLAGLRSAEAAYALGMTPVALSNAEAGIRAVTVAELRRMAQLLGVSFAWLAGVEPHPAANPSPAAPAPEPLCIGPIAREILEDPAASYWLKEAIARMAARDPVAARDDAARLLAACEERAGGATSLRNGIPWRPQGCPIP